MIERELTRRSFLELAAAAVGALAVSPISEAYAEDKPSSRKPASLLRVSQGGIDLIKQFEGFRETVYDPSPRDNVSEPTIGYGHLIKPGENYTSITRNDAEKLLRTDLGKYEQPVRKYVTVKLTQNQYDALTSFIYNIGEDAFKNSTLLKKLNRGDYNEAAEEFSRWNKSNGKVLKGLTKRRAKEKALFLKD